MPTTTPTLHQKGGQKTAPASHANIYFSDWSVSTLKESSELYLSSLKYTNTDNNLLTQIKLFLWTWEIFTKATSLNSEGSVFEIYTSDTSAAVRWTIFLVQSFWWMNTKISTIEWAVEIFQAENEKTRELILPTQWGITLEWWLETYIEDSMPLGEHIYPLYNTEDILETSDQTKEIIPENLPEWKSLEAILRGWDWTWDWEWNWEWEWWVTNPQTCDLWIEVWDYKNYTIDYANLKKECTVTWYLNPSFISCINNNYERVWTTLECREIIPTTPLYSCNTQPTLANIVKTVWLPTSENQEWVYNETPWNCTFKCKTNFVYIDWICIENTLLNGWTLVDYVENIAWTYSLAWILTWNNFAFEFETNWISTNTTKKEYIIYNSEKILYTQDTNLKIANNNEIIKYSENWENLNIIKIKFEWDIWNIVWINMSDEWVDWEPSLLEWNYIKLNNVKNVKIYKK